MGAVLHHFLYAYSISTLFGHIIELYHHKILFIFVYIWLNIDWLIEKWELYFQEMERVEI